MYKVIERTARLLELVGGFACALMAILVIIDVCSTTAFRTPIPGTLEIVAYWFMVAIVFLPVGSIEHDDASVCVDLFFNMAMPAAQRLMRHIATVATMIFFAILCHRTFVDAIDAFQKTEMVEGLWKIIVWPARFFLPIGFGWGILVLLARILRGIYPRFGDREKQQIEK